MHFGLSLLVCDKYGLLHYQNHFLYVTSQTEAQNFWWQEKTTGLRLKHKNASLRMEAKIHIETNSVVKS